jgi:citrate lyase subunit gamma (acyl carrier protein)
MVMIDVNEEEGIELFLKSTVQQQFGDDITEVALSVLKELGISRCKITLDDKGALDCTIIARVKTAAMRACKMNVFNWEAVND